MVRTRWGYGVLLKTNCLNFPNMRSLNWPIVSLAIDRQSGERAEPPSSGGDDERGIKDATETHDTSVMRRNTRRGRASLPPRETSRQRGHGPMAVLEETHGPST